MPYVHTYTCVVCKRDYRETDGDENSPQSKPRRLHCDVKSDRPNCIGLLKYVDTVEKELPPPQLLTLPNAALQHWKTLQNKKGMICAARLKQAPRVIMYGNSSHGISRTKLAGGLGAKLPIPVGVQEWDSDNCAEVHAAHLILKANNLTFGKSGGIEFAAIDAYGTLRPPCQNCAKWIGKV